MASTNRTENFELSLWEENDLLTRSDFNGDNKKIDRAIAEAGENIEEHKNDKELHVSEELIEELNDRITVITHSGTGYDDYAIMLPFEPSFVMMYKNEVPFFARQGENDRFSYGFASQSAGSFGMKLSGKRLTVKNNLQNTYSGVPRMNELKVIYSIVLFK